MCMLVMIRCVLWCEHVCTVQWACMYCVVIMCVLMVTMCVVIMCALCSNHLCTVMWACVYCVVTIVCCAVSMYILCSVILCVLCNDHMCTVWWVCVYCVVIICMLYSNHLCTVMWTYMYCAVNMYILYIDYVCTMVWTYMYCVVTTCVLCSDHACTVWWDHSLTFSLVRSSLNICWISSFQSSCMEWKDSWGMSVSTASSIAVSCWRIKANEGRIWGSCSQHSATNENHITFLSWYSYNHLPDGRVPRSTPVTPNQEFLSVASAPGNPKCIPVSPSVPVSQHPCQGWAETQRQAAHACWVLFLFLSCVLRPSHHGRITWL